VVVSDSADDDDDDAAAGSSRATSSPVHDDDLQDLSELSRSHSLPSHILHLRHAPAPAHASSGGHLQSARAVSVHSISTVLRGSQFGPFSCHVVDRRPPELSVDDCAASTDECRLEASCLLFSSLAVLDPRVGHTMHVLSPFIAVLYHSGWLGSRVVSVLDSCAEGPDSNRSRDAVW